jgi:anti-sigma regulatory factor (Ser/Thr protein kinase)
VSQQRKLTIANSSKHLSDVRGCVQEVLALSTFAKDVTNKIIVAVDEGLANVVEHAYQGGEGDITILFHLDDEVFRVQIQDNGVRFEPNQEVSDAVDIHRHIQLGLKGGLGLFLMRRIMDDVHYNHDGPDFVNELVMIKKVPSPGSV